ncbi:hypothetical protein SAMN05421641_11187 [Paracoccus thiocyanatus]|uniref:Uncharacterized protein n=1 Tax=Paracoccus thiocyanatus TaxID=34006 RepID=A0A1N6ULT5_9RHOB|nr:hypothetical protein [Paracoccus thiocyanatus]SIQ66276.1 hypothetical protein SAMN05421641_11187 [Paracoccus thiocyanatus]
MTAPPASAAPAEPGLDAMLLRVGRLNYAWSNTESLLIHLLAGLTGMDKAAAVVVFLSVSSTRGRIEMVERLAKLRLGAGPEQQELLDLTGRFTKLSAVRHRYNHSIWSFQEDGSVSTILMRIADRRDRIHMGRKQPLGEDEMQRLDRDLDLLSQLNRNIWRFLLKYHYPVA